MVGAETPAGRDGGLYVNTLPDAAALVPQHPPRTLVFAVVGIDRNFTVDRVCVPDRLTFQGLHDAIQKKTQGAIPAMQLYLAKPWGNRNAAWLEKGGSDFVELQQSRVPDDIEVKYLAPSKQLNAATIDAGVFDDLGNAETHVHVLVKPLVQPKCTPMLCGGILTTVGLVLFVLAIVGICVDSKRDPQGQPLVSWGHPLAQIAFACMIALNVMICVCGPYSRFERIVRSITA